MDVSPEMKVIYLDYKLLLLFLSCQEGPLPMSDLLEPRGSLLTLYMSNAAGLMCLGHLAKGNCYKDLLFVSGNSI